MIVEGVIAVIATVGAVFWLYRRSRRKMRLAFLAKYGVDPSDATDRLIVPMTERLINEGADWPHVEQAARAVMTDLWMLQGEQQKVLAIVFRVWDRGQQRFKALQAKWGVPFPLKGDDLADKLYLPMVHKLLGEGRSIADIERLTADLLTDVGVSRDQQKSIAELLILAQAEHEAKRQ